MGDEVVGGEKLVSHGQDVEGKNACYGEYDDTTKAGWGPAFQNTCIHSGINSGLTTDTVWYNYALASAGTIVDENTSETNPATNATTATESICPKGWTLPTRTQAQAIGNNTSTYVSNFSPVLGGYYRNGILSNETTAGYWWSNTAYNSPLRYYLGYDVGGKLSVSGGIRTLGRYIRCVPKS